MTSFLFGNERNSFSASGLLDFPEIDGHKVLQVLLRLVKKWNCLNRVAWVDTSDSQIALAISQFGIESNCRLFPWQHSGIILEKYLLDTNVSTKEQ